MSAFKISAITLFSLLATTAEAQTVKDYPLHTIGGSDTFITQTAPYGYFGRAEYLLVGGTSGSLYWSMMKWDMSTLPTLISGDKAELMLYGLNINGYQPTDMQLGMSATPLLEEWTDTKQWHFVTPRQCCSQIRSPSLCRSVEHFDQTICEGDEGGDGCY